MKKVLVGISLCLMSMGCSSEHKYIFTSGKPALVYGDKVLVIDGFYKGSKGLIGSYERCIKPTDSNTTEFVYCYMLEIYRPGIRITIGPINEPDLKLSIGD